MDIQGDEVKFNCFCDCRQAGCPGHTAKAIYHNASDIITVLVDGKEKFLSDPSEWAAIKRTVESVR